MSESVSYGNFNFKAPFPAIAENVEPVTIAGELDYLKLKVDLIGFITGDGIESIVAEKNRMQNAMTTGFMDLVVSVGSQSKTYPYSKPLSIEFGDSKLFSILPYTASFESYSSGDFSSYFGVENPENKWSFVEEDARIVSATHNISAVGIKTNSSDSLENAKNFVNSLTGFQNLSSFHKGSNAFLVSTTENINPLKKKYSLVETYRFDSSDDPVSNNGVGTVSVSIGYNRQSDLKIDVVGSIAGAIDGGINSLLLTTGVFSPDDATLFAKQSVLSTASEYESGVYSFVNNGPTTYEYTINTGENKVDFSFSFINDDDVEKIGNICHEYSSTISASKDQSTISVGVQGRLFFNSHVKIVGSGEFESNQRFLELEQVFSGINPLLIGTEALLDFQSGAGAEYKLSSSYIGAKANSLTINKNPFDNEITYNYQYDNRLDLSSGLLSNLSINITDLIPLELVKIQPSIGSFAQQIISDRTLGNFSISASCDEGSGKLPDLKSVVENYMTGFDMVITDSESVAETNISYSKSAVY